MAKKDLHYQCHLRNENGLETTAWIAERGAKANAKIELFEENGDSSWWIVEEVFQPPVDYKILREKQRMDRASLLSIKG